MNFYEAQSQAKRYTLYGAGMLALMVLAAVVCLSEFLNVLRYLLPQILSVVAPLYVRVSDIKTSDPYSFWHLFMGVSLFFLVSMACESWMLRPGGRAVAERLGAVRLRYAGANLQERRALHVVEEMALAAGLRAPPVYVLKDSSINALVAGTSPHNAVIGLTQGALMSLSRDELQAVVAHEFSHIFHGDMVLNTRLISVLSPLRVFSELGWCFLKPLRVDDEKNPLDAVVILWPFLLAVALPFLIVGSIGTCFASMISAAMCRQREFLADAAAVQFTRNPLALAGALKKMAVHHSGSMISSASTQKFSHMFLGESCRRMWGDFFTTHPPLSERIQCIDPHWNGEFDVVWETPLQARTYQVDTDEHTQRAPLPELVYPQGQISRETLEQAIESVGAPSKESLDAAQTVLTEIPANLCAAAHSPEAAPLLLGMLITRVLQRPDVLPEFQGLVQHEGERAFFLMEADKESLVALHPARYLNLVDMIIPALKELPQGLWLALVRDLSTHLEQHCISQRNLGEGHHRDTLLPMLSVWGYLQVMRVALGRKRRPVGNHSLASSTSAVGTLLGLLALCGHSDPEAAKAAYMRAATLLRLSLTWPSLEQLSVAALNGALPALEHLQWLEKPRLLKAMAECIMHDGFATAAEVELVRAVADCLDCPMPPIETVSRGRS